MRNGQPSRQPGFPRRSRPSGDGSSSGTRSGDSPTRFRFGSGIRPCVWRGITGSLGFPKYCMWGIAPSRSVWNVKRIRRPVAPKARGTSRSWNGSHRQPRRAWRAWWNGRTRPGRRCGAIPGDQNDRLGGALSQLLGAAMMVRITDHSSDADLGGRRAGRFPLWHRWPGCSSADSP